MASRRRKLVNAAELGAVQIVVCMAFALWVAGPQRCEGAPARDGFVMADWSNAQDRGWTFRDARTGGRDGSVTVVDGHLVLEDSHDGNPDWAEAVLARELTLADRFVLEFRARFHKLGMADEGTGNQSILRLSIGAMTPRGAFGSSFSFLLDRYNVETQTHVFRTDGRWHDWRLEIDAGRKTVALIRDGEYVCLHQTGSAQDTGLRIQVQGAQAAGAQIEIGSLSLQRAEPHFTEGRRAGRRPRPEIPPGDWPAWRRDAGNTGISPLNGNLKSAPAVAWSHTVGTQAPNVEIIDLDGDEREELLISEGGVLSAHRIDGDLLWRQRLDNPTIWGCDDLDGDGHRELIVVAGNPAEMQILSARDGRTRFRFAELSKTGVAGVRLAHLDAGKRGLQAVVWSGLTEIGYGLSFGTGIEQPSIDWSFDWKKTFFNPCTALADIDRDGRLDLVAVTYNSVFVFDTATGKPKLSLDWNSGRNYGTLVVKDVDADGWPDVIVLADVLREHVAVIRNQEGKSIKLLWDKFYEQNYPDDHAALRVLVESVDDFDGDGRCEIAYSVFDDRVDGRWRTMLVDAVTGESKHEFVDAYLIGAGRLFPGRPSVLFLSRPSDRTHLATERPEIWSAAGGKPQKAGDLPPGTLLATRTPRSYELESWGQGNRIQNGKPTALLQPLPGQKGPDGLLVACDGGRRAVFVAGAADGALKTVWEVKLAEGALAGKIVGLARSRRAEGAVQVVHSGNDGYVRVFEPKAGRTAEIPFSTGPITTPLVARLREGELPSIVYLDGEPRLHCLRSPAPGVAAQPVWSLPAHGWTTPYVASLKAVGVPLLADIDGDGQREVLVARDPDLLIALDSSGAQVRAWKFPARPTQWAVGRFDDDDIPDLVVTYPISPVLDTATVVVSGRDGKTKWRSHCGNGPLAVYDFDGDGIDDVIMRDLYERRTLDGLTGRDLVPFAMHPGYHTPVIARFDAKQTAPRISWLGGSWSLSADAADGAQLWNHWLTPTGVQGIGEPDGDGRLAIGGITAGQIYELGGRLTPIDGPDRDFLCHDLASGRLKWSLHVGSTSPGCITGDLDGDGRHEFLLGTTDGRLLALRGASPEAGAALWEISLPAAAGVPVICDADGDGKMDVFVSCADGKLYCLGANPKAASK